MMSKYLILLVCRNLKCSDCFTYYLGIMDVYKCSMFY